MTSIKGTHSTVDNTVVHQDANGAYCDVVHKGMELVTTMRIRKVAWAHTSQTEDQGLRSSPSKILRHPAIPAPAR